MENKYSHLSVSQLQEALNNAKKLVAEQEASVMEYAKDMGKKKNTLADVKHLNSMMAFAFERIAEYTGWVKDYEEALSRAEKVEAGHEAIVEFLEHIYDEDVKWYERLKADYQEKGYEGYIEMLRRDEITKTAFDFARMTSQDAKKIFKHDIEVRYAKLVHVATKKVGTVIKIDVERNWNQGFDGLVTGENGTCRLWTVLAGGFNIQRLHYRTLCK